VIVGNTFRHKAIVTGTSQQYKIFYVVSRFWGRGHDKGQGEREARPAFYKTLLKLLDELSLVELRRLGGTGQGGGGGGATGDDLRHLVEVAGAHLALMLCSRVAVLLGGELLLL